MKHTEGPLSVRGAVGTDGTVKFYDIEAPAGHDIGYAIPNDSPFDGKQITMEEAKANAHLWARAPTMLALLERVLESVPFASYRGDGELDELETDIKNEIATAKGGE